LIEPGLDAWRKIDIRRRTWAGGTSSSLSFFVEAVMVEQSGNTSNRNARRWPLWIGGGLLAVGVVVAGSSLASRQAAAQDSKSAEDIQEKLRKTLDSLKKGPEPATEPHKPADLNPVDELRQREEALKKAQQDLRDNPKSEEARKAAEEARRNYEESLRKNRPNLRLAPIAPIDPADLEKEIERFNRETQRMMEEMQRQMLPFQQGQFPGRLLIPGNRFGRAQGEFRLGLRLERPTPVLVDQLDLPAERALVVAMVMPDSPAAKAGVRVNDILLEIGGKEVSSNALELQRQMQEIKADEKVDIVVMRKGKKETIKGVAVPALPAPPELNVPIAPQPNLRRGQFPPEAFGGGGGRMSMMSISINNGEFTIRCSDDGRNFTVVGHKDDGGPQVSSIEIAEGGKVTKAKSIDDVDARFRPTVEKMLKSIR
jgi:hypothetical protein